MKLYKIIFVIVFLTVIFNLDSLDTVTEKLMLKSISQSVQCNADTTIFDNTLIGSNLSSQDAGELLDFHNKVRSDVGVGPVTWSNKLAIYAQQWANHLAVTDCNLEHRPHSGKWKQRHGENLFMGTTGYFQVADAVRSWESEKKYYYGQELNSSNWHDSGHYTQIVWKDTRQIGCAKAECNGNFIVVCNYDPPGNVVGQKPY